VYVPLGSWSDGIWHFQVYYYYGLLSLTVRTATVERCAWCLTDH